MQMMPERLQYICLYDLPKAHITNSKITKIIGDLCGYDNGLQIHIKTYPDGIHPEIGYAIIRINKESLSKLTSTMDYFNIEIGKDTNGEPFFCLCRVLPFESILMKMKRESIQETLDEVMTDSFEEAKSAMISMFPKDIQRVN